jgi:hypothetical protein
VPCGQTNAPAGAGVVTTGAAPGAGQDELAAGAGPMQADSVHASAKP